MEEDKKERHKKDWTKEDWKAWKKGHHHGGNGIGALILITLGVLLLLNNFGIISSSIWQILWRFWPVLLILWGIRAVLGRNIISDILSLVIIALVISFAISSVNPMFSSWLHHYLPWWQPQTLGNQNFDQYPS